MPEGSGISDVIATEIKLVVPAREAYVVVGDGQIRRVHHARLLEDRHSLRLHLAVVVIGRVVRPIFVVEVRFSAIHGAVSVL